MEPLNLKIVSGLEAQIQNFLDFDHNSESVGRSDSSPVSFWGYLRNSARSVGVMAFHQAQEVRFKLTKTPVLTDGFCLSREHICTFLQNYILLPGNYHSED